MSKDDKDLWILWYNSWFHGTRIKNLSVERVKEKWMVSSEVSQHLVEAREWREVSENVIIYQYSLVSIEHRQLTLQTGPRFTRYHYNKWFPWDKFPAYRIWVSSSRPSPGRLLCVLSHAVFIFSGYLVGVKMPPRETLEARLNMAELLSDWVLKSLHGRRLPHLPTPYIAIWAKITH